MNWGAYSRLVGNIFGAPLAMEGLAAFFLEIDLPGVVAVRLGQASPPAALCLTIWWSRSAARCRRRLPRRPTSWMQHPVGYVMVNGKPVLNDIWAVFTNPVFTWGYAKVLFVSLVTGASVMLAISAWQLRHGGDRAACSPGRRGSRSSSWSRRSRSPCWSATSSA